MLKALNIVLLALTLLCVNNIFSSVILVENTLDSGPGSLRDAITSAASGDTIYIDIKGTIVLDNEIRIEDFGALTIIGPYPKHNTITAGSGWSGSFIHIENSGPINIKGLGFDGGTGETRHITIENCSEEIKIERCLFENNLASSPGFEGSAAYIDDSFVKFEGCSFINNSCATGTISVEGTSDLYVINSTFSDNEASAEAAVLFTNGNSYTYFHYNTVIQNNSTGSSPEAILVQGNSTLRIENNAIGENGTDIQLAKIGGSSTIVSAGGNVGMNNPGETLSTYLNHVNDHSGVSPDIVFGLRSEIKEDGFGLKYWPIVDQNSTLINPAVGTGYTPDYDCRKAPRSLKGPSATNVYPDAGAAEYTHLRVTDVSAGTGVPNSFLWAISEDQRKEDVHYIEFDVLGGTAEVLFNQEGNITGAVYIIDGFTQDGSAIPGPHQTGTPGLTRAEIEVDFIDGTGNDHGINFLTDSEQSILQGVSIQGFGRHGLEMNVPFISAFGNEIGFDELEAENGNQRAGLRLNSSYNTIGGWEHWQRNVISGNGLDADPEKTNVHIANGNYNKLYGNIIGGAPNGLGMIDATMPTQDGIYLGVADYNEIGGTLPNSGNIIIHHQYGIYLFRSADANTIINNKIGIGWDDLTAAGNTEAGIMLGGADFNTIGSFNNENGNIIAHNGKGISLATDFTTAANNRIIGNSIHNNIGMGIDLENDGAVLANDGVLNGFQQNSGIDFPVILSSTNCGDSETITTFELSVPTGEEYRIEFFSVTSPDVSHGEGEFYIGDTTVIPVTNPQTFTFHHGFFITPGTHISSTCTDLINRNTSEFGTNATVSGSLDPSFSYEDICPDEEASPTITGDTGGSFRFKEPPADGEIIDSATGEITGAQEGETYFVIYGFEGGCLNEDTVSFTVIEVIETFEFADFCADESSPAPVPDGITGTFTFGLPAPDDAVSINAVTGIINNPQEGDTYPVVHTLTTDGCTQSDTVLVMVEEVDETFVFEDICEGAIGYPSGIETPGGVFSFAILPGDGATINSATGALDNSIGGATYQVKYVTSFHGCFDSLTLPVDVIEVNPSFDFADFCPGPVSPAPVPEVAGGTYSFETPPTGSEIIDPSSGIITAPTEGATYDIIYTLTVEGCTDLDTVMVDVLEVNEGFIFEDFCWDVASPEADPFVSGGDFTFGTLPADGATIDIETGIITSPTEGSSYTVAHTLTIGACTQSDTLVVTALGVDESFVFEDFCPSPASPAPVPATAGGTYDFPTPPDDGATIDPISGIITGAIEGTTYNVRYSVDDLTGTCNQSSIETVEVITTDEDFLFPAFCAEFAGVPSPPTTAGGAFTFGPDPGDGAIINGETGIITNAVSGASYTVIYTVGECAEQDTNVVYAKPSEDASFSFDDHCANLNEVPNVSGTTGGTFDFLTTPEDDATIDDSTGIISNSTGGDYTIRYITPGTALTCSDTALTNITLYALPVIIDISTERAIYCPDMALVPMEVTDYNLATKIYWYDNLDNPPLDSLFSYTPETLNLGDNTFYLAPISADGCLGAIESYNLFLSDTAGMKAIDDFQVCMGTAAQLEAYGGQSYLWETTALLSDNTSAAPTAFSLNKEIYIVSIFNAEGCEVVDSTQVTFYNRIECQIEVHNAFSPNGDGTNDFWYIDNLINYLPNTVYIYNRWGDELNEITDYDNITNYWDGTDKNGRTLPPGTYFYVVISDDPVQNQAGWVQIVR